MDAGADPLAANGSAADDDAALERLRELLLPAERDRIERLEGAQGATQEQVDALHFDAHDVARELPEAIRLAMAKDAQLSLALEEPVEGAIRRSVNKNPRVLTDAIFPLIGPAIRKAIRESLASLVEGFNTALEHSLTIRGLRWRVEAWRTGRPFSEVVLLHCLVYRVEELFLIHRETGLLLEQITSPRVQPKDPDVVSAMLTAIGDFVHDSFDYSRPEEELEGVQVGGTEVLIEPVPKLVLSAMVRGRVPEDFRARMRECAESISLDFANELDEFEGNTTPFLLARAPLEDLLVERFVEGREPERRRRPFAIVLTAIVALAAVAPLVVWLVGRSYERGRWDEAWAALADEPGVVVVRVERRAGGYEVHGMRDPDAADPRAFLEAAGLPVEGVRIHMDRFRSLEAPIVLARLRRRAGDAPGAELVLEAERLVASGRAPHAFVTALEEAVRDEPGVFELDRSGLVDADLERLRAELRGLEGFAVEFRAGTAQIDLARSGEALDERFASLAASAEAANREVRVRIVGSPEPGSPALAPERAAVVRDHVAGLALGARVQLELAEAGADHPGLEPGRVVRFVALDPP